MDIRKGVEIMLKRFIPDEELMNYELSQNELEHQDKLRKEKLEKIFDEMKEKAEEYKKK